MSGGLLEKAKQASGDSDDDVNAAAEAVIEADPAPKSESNKAPILMYAAIASLVVSMVLLFMLSDLPDFSGFAVLLIFIASFAVAWLHIKNERNSGE